MLHHGHVSQRSVRRGQGKGRSPREQAWRGPQRSEDTGRRPALDLLAEREASGGAAACLVVARYGVGGQGAGSGKAPGWMRTRTA